MVSSSSWYSRSFHSTISKRSCCWWLHIRALRSRLCWWLFSKTAFHRISLMFGIISGSLWMVWMSYNTFLIRTFLYPGRMSLTSHCLVFTVLCGFVRYRRYEAISCDCWCVLCVYPLNIQLLTVCEAKLCHRKWTLITRDPWSCLPEQGSWQRPVPCYSHVHSVLRTSRLWCVCQGTSNSP